MVAMLLNWTNVSQANFFRYIPDISDYELSKHPEQEIITLSKPDDGDWLSLIKKAAKRVESINECLALSSEVLDQDKKEKHLLFFDMTGRFYGTDQFRDSFVHFGSEIKDEGYCVINSGRSYHVYTKQLLTFGEWIDRLCAGGLPLMGSGFEGDKRWILRSIYRRAGSLRLIKHDLKPGIPVVHDYNESFAGKATYHNDYKPLDDPDNDLPF
ncbi:MAG: hypothetical protein GY938_13205 [Ketobacter sp.]|nr:hypothetical protein [Ketobacter sp.]